MHVVQPMLEFKHIPILITPPVFFFILAIQPKTITVLYYIQSGGLAPPAAPGSIHVSFHHIVYSDTYLHTAIKYNCEKADLVIACI